MNIRNTNKTIIFSVVLFISATQQSLNAAPQPSTWEYIQAKLEVLTTFLFPKENLALETDPATTPPKEAPRTLTLDYHSNDMEASINEALAEGAEFDAESFRLFLQHKSGTPEVSGISNTFKVAQIERLLEKGMPQGMATSTLAYGLKEKALSEATRLAIIEQALDAGGDLHDSYSSPYWTQLRIFIHTQNVAPQTWVRIMDLLTSKDPGLLDVDDNEDNWFDTNDPLQGYKAAYFDKKGMHQPLTTQLWAAIEQGNLATVQALLESGLDVDTPIGRNNETSPLYLAVACGHMELTQYLLEAGASLTNHNGNIELFKTIIFADRPSSEVTEYLLEHGIRDSTEPNLSLAAQRGILDVIKAFEAHGLDIATFRDGEGKSVAHHALSACVPNSNTLSTLIYALESGVPVDAQDASGNTPLMQAIQTENYVAMAYLIKGWDADIHIANNEGDTPIKSAKDLHDLNIEDWKKRSIEDTAAIKQSQNLLLCWLLDGKAGLERQVESGKTLIGILVATDRPEYDLVLNEYREHPGVAIGYFTPEMMHDPGVLELFSGFIVPGASDSFPKDLEHYTAEDIEKNPTPTEHFYQRMIPQILKNKVPMIGVCAGAQHFMMAHGGNIVPADNQDEKDALTINKHTWQYFLMLDKEAQNRVLETCQAEDLVLSVRRAHTYAVDPQSIENHSFEMGSASPHGNIMAYAKNFRAIFTQFHPENYYTFNESNHKPEEVEAAKKNSEYQKNYLNRFIELCIDHDRWVRVAKHLGMEVDHMLELRDAHFQKMHDRLKECRAAESDAA